MRKEAQGEGESGVETEDDDEDYHAKYKKKGYFWPKEVLATKAPSAQVTQTLPLAAPYTSSASTDVEMIPSGPGAISMQASGRLGETLDSGAKRQTPYWQVQQEKIHATQGGAPGIDAQPLLSPLQSRGVSSSAPSTLQ